jgi:pimeloyl-ACP methyl ester carboxylesterase
VSAASLDQSDVELPGPWTHRYLSANGARFHVCQAQPASRNDGPLVLLLHGFPEFWWAWRHQMPALAAAGYEAVAMDLRGYGGSDKTPRGYDLLTLSQDVTGAVRALGSRHAIVVGHGWGGYVAWTAAARSPDVVRALGVVAAPHPLALTRSPASWRNRQLLGHLLAMQVPWLPERRIARSEYVEQHLARWSAPGSVFPTAEEAGRYRTALSRWPSPHCALEYHRWLLRSRLRADGRAFANVMRRPIDVPVLAVDGAQDPTRSAAAVARAAARRVSGPYAHETMAESGHFPHEERPDVFNRLLLDWLSQCAPTGADRAV